MTEEAIHPMFHVTNRLGNGLSIDWLRFAAQGLRIVVVYDWGRGSQFTLEMDVPREQKANRLCV